MLEDDKSIQWTLADPLAILIDPSNDVWYSGAARDVLARGPEAVLVASDTGGLWLANRGGTATPVGDFDLPDFSCVVQGVHGDDHIYAGGAGLYETDLSQPVPVLSWRSIPLTCSVSETNNHGIVVRTYTVQISAVYRIAVTRHPDRVVITAPEGVFWSDVPPPPAPPAGCLATLLGQRAAPYVGGYVWHKALGLTDTVNGYLGLAVGPVRPGEDAPTVAVASWGKDPEPMGLYSGSWENGDLSFRASIVADPQAAFRRASCATTIASCDADPARMYAISAELHGFPLALFRSRDGGQSWESSTPNIVDPKGMTLAAVAGGQGNDTGRWCQSIAVARGNPDVVVFSWRYSGFFVSTDAGDTWRRTGESPHVHGDTHAVYFDPNDPAGEQIYLATDGGVTSCPSLGTDPTRFESVLNREIASLQFQSTPARAFVGGSSAARGGASIFAGGLQDNGVVVATQSPPVPWVQFAVGGDGHFVTWLSTGHALWNDNSELIPGGGTVVRHSLWNSATSTLADAVNVPVWKQDPLKPYLVGLPYPATVTNIATPSWRNSDDHLMYAIAGVGSSLYGFFSSPVGSEPHWEFLARFGLNDHLTPDQVTNSNYEPWSISAVGSHNGNLIVIGTIGGRLISFRQSDRIAREVAVPFRNDPWGDDGSSVDRIVVTSDELAFATYRQGSSQGLTGGYHRDDVGFVLRVRGVGSEVVPMLADDGYYGLELADGREQQLLFAASDSRVYVSYSRGAMLGDTWAVASQGLPARPHCADLSFTAAARGDRWLYLATYGRSVWRAAL